MERPLTGEPLGVDLLNTAWIERSRYRDCLSTLAGLRRWVQERGLPASRADEQVRAALVHTRSVLRDVIDGIAGAEEQLNAVLARGLIVRASDHGQVRERVVLSDEARRLAWQAADDYLRLRSVGPASIRRCAQPPCVLYFYDPSGRRRWCSMAVCGNRAKARRHYAREKATGSKPEPTA